MNSTYVKDGEVLIRTDEEEADRLADIQANASVVNVPQFVTRRQAIQQLRIEGITEAQIVASIGALPLSDLEKDLALIEFKESQVFERNRLLVATLGAMLGKDTAATDAMFIAANKL
jgi:hypothetical protein